MQRIFLNYKSSRVSCLSFGTGDKLLFAFHGFGDRAAMFLSVAASLGREYKIYAVDLPFHGHTVWREAAFDTEVFNFIVNEISAREKKYKYDLMGYSFGAKIVERLFLKQPERIGRLFLLAPDGFYHKQGLEITMIPKPVRYLSKWLLQRPTWLIRLTTFLYKRRLIDRFIFDFTMRHLNRIDRHSRLFTYWLSMDDFITRPKDFVTEIKLHATQTVILCGIHDDIISLKKIEKTFKNIRSVSVFELNAAHKLITPDLNDFLSKILSKKSFNIDEIKKSSL